MPTQSGTQWDSLAHIFHRGQMWNGYSAADHSSAGAARNGIERWADKLVLRGVLVDVARLHGVDALEPGYAVTVEDIERCLEASGLTVGRGDALVVRTGHLGARRGAWGDYAGGSAPGLSLHTAPWLHEHEVAAIVSDTWGIEVRPNEIAALPAAAHRRAGAHGPGVRGDLRPRGSRRPTAPQTGAMRSCSRRARSRSPGRSAHRSEPSRSSELPARDVR